MKYKKTPIHPRYSTMKAFSYCKVLWSCLGDDGEVVFYVKWYDGNGRVESVEKCHEHWIEPIRDCPAEKEDYVRCTSIW